MGRELNPRIKDFDIKFFCEMRPGLIGWVRPKTPTYDLWFRCCIPSKANEACLTCRTLNLSCLYFNANDVAKVVNSFFFLFLFLFSWCLTLPCYTLRWSFRNLTPPPQLCCLWMPSSCFGLLMVFGTRYNSSDMFDIRQCHYLFPELLLSCMCPICATYTHTW